MTIVKITAASGPFIWKGFSGYAELSSETPELATFVSPLSDYVLTVSGKGLEFDNGTLVDGQVENLTLRTSDGEVALKLDGFYDARELGARLLLDVDTEAFESFLYAGVDIFKGSKVADRIFGGSDNDTIAGGRGKDELNGGDGDDTLTGGVGRDTFHFVPSLGSDTVTDFDAVGGQGRQDVLSIVGIDYDDFVIRKAGDDVLIELGGDDVLRLLDVKLKDIDAGDFLLTLPI